MTAFRFAGSTALFLAALVSAPAPAWAQGDRDPPVPSVKIQKIVIDSGLSHTVKYFVEGGSPRLQALVRTLQWAENEVTLIEQLQDLKLETVVNERRVLAGGFRGSGGSGGESSLRKGLAHVLTYEATPEAAIQIIQMLEQAQTDLDAELKQVSQKERQAAQGYVVALRAKVAALPRPQNNAPRPLRPGDAARFRPGDRALVEWRGQWWDATVLKTQRKSCYIHYVGWGTEWDEWVGPSRISR